MQHTTQTSQAGPLRAKQRIVLRTNQWGQRKVTIKPSPMSTAPAQRKAKPSQAMNGLSVVDQCRSKGLD